MRRGAAVRRRGRPDPEAAERLPAALGPAKIVRLSQTILRNVCSGRAHSCCNSFARFMLRRVRDKLYQDGAGLPPQGRTVRCPSLSPPARGTAPFCSTTFGRFRRVFVSSGGRPPDPRCGLAPANRCVVLSRVYVFLGTTVLMPRCGCACEPLRGFCWGFAASGDDPDPGAGCASHAVGCVLLGVCGFWGCRPCPVRAGGRKPVRGFCGGFTASGGGGRHYGPRCGAGARRLLRGFGGGVTASEGATIQAPVLAARANRSVVSVDGLGLLGWWWAPGIGGLMIIFYKGVLGVIG